MASRVDFEAVKTLRAYEHIVSQIETAIATGTLKPGQRLPSEREMMENFSVSRPTVREALRVLESTGVVRSRHGDPHGPQILPPSSDLLFRPLSQLVRTKNLDLDDFIPLRMNLESLACALAATFRDEVHLTQMQTAIEGMRRVIDDDQTADEFGLADLDFHQAVWEASGNMLVSLFGNVTQGLMLDMIKGKLVSASDSRAVMRLSHEHDSEILEAIQEQNADRAAYLARRYIFEYYGDYVADSQRAFLESLVGDEPS